jgi:hypothetical protein
MHSRLRAHLHDRCHGPCGLPAVGRVGLYRRGAGLPGAGGGLRGAAAGRRVG